MNDRGESVRVLHVDDDPDFADMVATFLEREDERFEVETATSVSEALERLESADVDCVVSDYDMPEQNGLAFLEQVRERSPDLPFILYTGKGSESIASEAISAGVTDYLQKERGTGQYTVLANRIRNSVDRYHTQRALVDREKRLNLFFEESPLGTVEWNEDFEFVRVNERAEEILGYTEAELVGESWEHIVPESEQAPVGAVVDDLLSASGGYHSFNENVRKDGEHVVCEWHNRVVTDDAGDTVAIFSMFQDVTEREERKRELERYEAYLAESTDIITVLDESGVIKYQSPSVSRILGYEEGELLGENGFEYIHPDDRDQAFEAFTDLIAEPGDTVTVEFRFRTADGDWRWLEVRGTNRLGQDPIDGVVTNNRDISDRKEREQDLEAAMSRLNALFEHSPDMINVHDADGNIIDPNPRLCERTGFDADELTEMKVWDLDETLDPESARDLWDRMDAGDRHRLEGTFRCRDGRTFPVEVHVRRLDLNGSDRFVAISRDITDRKRYERELEHQNARLEEFAGVVSHDLRNPLNIAEGRLELAREEEDSEHLEAVSSAHERMSTLIDDLLRLARTGRDVSGTTRVDLADLAEQCWKNVDTSEATLQVGDVGEIWADRNRVVQLVENLMRNAVEHGGPAVTVTVGQVDGGFYVEDDGRGIAEDEREEVFTAGYSTGEDSTGLGLRIVKDIAEAHGWDVHVTEGTEGGARFVITGVEVAE